MNSAYRAYKGSLFEETYGALGMHHGRQPPAPPPHTARERERDTRKTGVQYGTCGYQELANVTVTPTDRCDGRRDFRRHHDGKQPLFQ